MMNRFFTLLLAAFSLTAVGQVTYPYNPDEDGNGQIAVADLQGILATYGNEFSPSEILVDGETLTTVLTQLQNSIDSLSSLSGGGGSVLDMPLGTVLPIATESVPEGWMLCDGREISIEEYQDLYDLIGTTYGAGDSAFWAQVFYPATTFNIPDLRGRTIIGANDMGGEQSNVLTIHQASAGQVGGEEMHQLTEEEMPSHNHVVNGYLLFNDGGSQNGNVGLGDPVSQTNPTSVQELTESAGGDQPHNNMQPYMALNYMIKVLSSDDVVGQLTQLITEQQEQLGELQQSIFNDSRQLQCVAMGSAWNCSPFDESTGYFSLEPQSNFVFPLASGCSCDAGVLSYGPTWRRFNLSGYPAGQDFKLLVQYSTSSNQGPTYYKSEILDLVEVEDGTYSFLAHTQNYPPNNGPCPTNGLPAEDAPSNVIVVSSIGGYTQSNKREFTLTVLLENKLVGQAFYIDFGF